MSIAIKSATEIANKWQTVTPGRSAQYAEGVKAPLADWAGQTAAAAANYQAGVQAAIGKQRFQKGVAKAGTAGWQKGAIEKGVSRFGQGVSMAGPAYAEGFAPYASTIAGLTLPARRPAGDPGNIDRVRVVAAALNAKKNAS